MSKLKIAWQVELPGDGTVNFMAVDGAGRLFARMDRFLFEVARDDGAILSTVELDSVADDGRFLICDDARLLTDVRPDPDRTTTIVAVADGAVAWRRDLPIIVQSGGAAVADHLWAVGHRREDGARLCAIRLADGELVDDVEIDAAQLVAVAGDGRVALGNRRDGSPGLHLRSPDGVIVPIEDAPVRALTWTAAGLFPVFAGDDGGRWLERRETPETAIWRRQVSHAFIAADGEAIAAPLQTEEGLRLALLAIDDGEPSWSVALADEPQRVGLARSLVYVATSEQLSLFARNDGTHLGDVEFGASLVTTTNGELLVGGWGDLTFGRVD